jgi:hypothetical protein
MMVVLKIPIAALLYIVWWASRPPEAEGDHSDGEDRGGGNHPREPLPRPPRRGPHADPPPGSPRRVRVTSRRRTPKRSYRG